MKVASRILQQSQYEYKDYLNGTIILAGVDNLEGACIYDVWSGGTITKRIIAMNGSDQLIFTDMLINILKKIWLRIS